MMSYTHYMTETMISYESRVHKTTKTALYVHLCVFVWYAYVLLKGAMYIIQILCRRYTFWSYPAGLTIADPPG